MKKISLLLLLYLLPVTLLAEAVGNKNGLLQQMTHNQVDQRIHEHLISQIKIDNPQFYTVNEMHTHHAIPWCTKTTRHKHAGKRNHTHRYDCKRAMVKRALAAPRPAPQVSSTNVQEQGVDEADFVKTDGRYLFAIEDSSRQQGIRVYDTQYKGDQLKQISAVGFGKDIDLQGMYLLPKQQKLVVIGRSYRNKVRNTQRGWGSNTSIIVVDIRNKRQPRILRHTLLEGYPKTTRRINNRLYLVLNSYSVNFPSTYKYLETTKPLSANAMAAEKQKMVDEIKQWSIRDQIPRYRTYGKPGVHSLVRSGSFFLNPDDLTHWSLTTILAIDLTAPDFRFQSMGWFGDSWGTVYASQKALYLTSGYYNAKKYPLSAVRFPEDQSNQLIHKFAYQKNGFDYRGSGAVLGEFKWGKLSSFQLDEDQHGNLRVVTSNWRTSKNSKDPATQSPVVLTAMAEHPKNKQLITLSRLPNKASPKALGKPGEQLYGARLFDDYAYFVTFKRTDPLYVVDLRNPRKLRVTGELIIPGFSDYLHPMGDGLLLGVGMEAEDNPDSSWAQLQGVKLSLFDIKNPRHPREIHKISIGKRGSGTPANRDHHAFTSLAMRGTSITRVALPISVVDDPDNYDRRDGLHRFEVDRKKRKISHLGPMQPPNGNNRWRWYGNDRSIIIGDQLYYYHKGHFWKGEWKGKM